MNSQRRFNTTTAAIAALGGFLMGFDASVISGVVTFIEPEFNLSKIQLGWSVASLALTASFAMLVAGPLSDRLGRIPTLKIAALLFFVSAISSALAQSFSTLVMARMLGGLGVGTALIIAPMYIAEISPAQSRGRMVSFNQLNIVVGISVAFFTNYLILNLGESSLSFVDDWHIAQWNWRWMLGIEAVPALLYFLCLHRVPESPRWLLMQGQHQQALNIMTRSCDRAQAEQTLAEITTNLATDTAKTHWQELFNKTLRLPLAIGLIVAILQQITGINAVFFYAPMIFEQSGIGTDAAFMQAVFVGITNLVFTVLAMSIIDKVGRKPLLVAGVSGIAFFMGLLAYGFSAQGLNANLEPNPTLILIGILGFVASFAISLGPVMWVLFSELFPNRIRAIAISFLGLINSAFSFLVQLVFPWQLENLGNSATFFIYGIFAIIGLLLIIRILPETKGQSLEAIEGLFSNKKVIKGYI